MCHQCLTYLLQTPEVVRYGQVIIVRYHLHLLKMRAKWLLILWCLSAFK